MVGVDLVADLNAEDDDGRGWSTLADARDPERVTPGAMLLAGNAVAQAVVRIVAIDDDGQIHFTVLPGSVAKNRHLLDGPRPPVYCCQPCSLRCHSCITLPGSAGSAPRFSLTGSVEKASCDAAQ